jgi:prevent-host-death family protein
MKRVSVPEARRHLSRLVDRAAEGESFVITRSGKPLVKVMALGAPDLANKKRVGFLAGWISVPDDFDRMGQSEIDAAFTGGR